MSIFSKLLGGVEEPTRADEFRSLALDALHKQLNGYPVVLRKTEDPYSWEVVSETDGGVRHALNLHNLATEIVGQGLGRSEASARIADFARMIESLFAPQTIQPQQLYLALRPTEIVCASGEPLLDDRIGDLQTAVAQDHGQHVALLSTTSIADSGYSKDDVVRHAESNLLRVLSSTALYNDEDGIISLQIDDYEWLSASLLLVPGMLQRAMASRGIQTAYVAAPAVDEVQLIDASAHDALHVLERWMRSSFEQARRNSEVIFRLTSAPEARPQPAFCVNEGGLTPYS